MYYLLLVCLPLLTKISSDAIRKSFIESGFVTVDLQGQFGNQLFEIATAYAYSLDHYIPFSIPTLFRDPRSNIATNASRLFTSRILAQPLPRPSFTWHEPSLSYTPIPSHTHIRLSGYFQSEKYFLHRRAEILQLFAPPPDLLQTILQKYPFLSSDNLVAVQIRDYRREWPDGREHPTRTRSYYAKAVQHFPNATFLVSTNNLTLAKECMEELSPNIIYLTSNDYIEEFYALTLCKSFIISNSSFGWWAAWLSTRENKTVIAPRPWLAAPYNDAEDCKDIIPDDWVTVYN